MSTSRQIYARKQGQTHHKSTLVQQALQLIQQKRQNIVQEEYKNQHDCSLPLIQPHILKDKIKNKLQLKDESSDGQDKNNESLMFTRSPIMKYKTVLQDTNPQSQLQVTPAVQHSTLNSSIINIKIKTEAPKLHIHRFKSEHHEAYRKSTQKTQIELPSENEKTLTAEQFIKNAKKQFVRSLAIMPKQSKYRNESTLAFTINNLNIFNPFFSRNHRIVNVCLLKVGKIIFKQNSLLYKLGEQSQVFYIILSGRVKLVNGTLKRTCQTGETVLEEILYLQRQKKISLERAKAVGKVYLLELSVGQLLSMREEMIKHRFKQEMQEMQAIIKRNYIIKSWLRNKIKTEAQI